MKRLFQASLLLLVLLAGSTPLFAHHGNASYENKEVTIKGKVTQWLWSNPHTFLMLDVTDASPATVGGVVELGLDDGQLRRRSIAPHPSCGCGAADDSATMET